MSIEDLQELHSTINILARDGLRYQELDIAMGKALRDIKFLVAQLAEGKATDSIEADLLVCVENALATLLTIGCKQYDQYD